MGTSITNYKKLKEKLAFELGICFLCKENCNKESYVHQECAVAYNDAKEKKLIEIAKNEKM